MKSKKDFLCYRAETGECQHGGKCPILTNVYSAGSGQEGAEEHVEGVVNTCNLDSCTECPVGRQTTTATE